MSPEFEIALHTMQFAELVLLSYYTIMISRILKENSPVNRSTLKLTFEFYTYEFKLFDLWLTMSHITTTYGLSELYGTYNT